MPSVKYYTELDLTTDNKIVNLKDPTLAQDAATKRYVDVVSPYSLGGDMIYLNPTGSAVVATQGEHAGYVASGGGWGLSATRVVGLTTGHRIRLTYEAKTRGGGGHMQRLAGYMTGGAVAIIAATPNPSTALTNVWVYYTVDLTLTSGTTEVQLETMWANENDFRNMIYTDLDAASPSRLPIGDDAAELNVVDGLPAWVVPAGRIEIGFDGHGQAPATGVKTDFVVPYPMRITGWTVVADVAGSAQLDLWRAAYANYPPTVADSVTGSDKPRLSSELKAQSVALTDWVKDWAADDLVRVNLDSAETLTRATVILSFIRI
jgi:hypothetical protein